MVVVVELVVAAVAVVGSAVVSVDRGFDKASV